MSINYSNLKKKFYKLKNSKILKIDNFLENNFLNKIKEEITLLEKKNQSKAFYLKGKSDKLEYLDFGKFQNNSRKLIKILSGKKFKLFLKKNLKIDDTLYPDSSNSFSGFNIVKKNGFLKTHADFNFNNKIKKFRTLNLLIYFNSAWKKNYGGNLSLYDYSSRKPKYTFLAQNNRCLVFITNKYTPHGYKKLTTNKKRVSLNFYYYTKKNFSYSEKPHKTIWW